MEKHSKLSVFLSLILRHKPEEIGMKLNEEGFVNVEELLDNMCKHGKQINKQMLDEIVQTDNKQRYSYNDNETMVRANQGHSIKVNLNLVPIIPNKPLFHGTGESLVDSILKTGLNKRKREYVHLSENIDTALNVGSRKGIPIILEIDTEQMTKDGLVFYQSKNNVWLTDHVPSKYIKVHI